MKKVAILLVIVFIIGCAQETKTYTVYKEYIPVLEVKNQPGYLVSTGYFPDIEPVEHPFLDAKALNPDYEDELGQIIRDSNTFNDFLISLTEHRYDVVEGEAEAVDEEKVKPKKMQIIKVYVDEGKALGEIFLNTEIREVIVSTTAEGDLLAALMNGINAAKSQNLTLESDEYMEIDGEIVLALISTVVEPTNPDYIFALRYFLSFESGWEADLFDFDLVEVDEWTAYKDGNAIIEFQNIKDGFLISAGPGIVEPAIHPFLNAKFLEDELEVGDILDESSSFLDFMTKLVENDYLVISEEGESLLS